MTDNRIGVFLLVQNRLLREGLERLLRKEADIRVIGVSALDLAINRQIIDFNPNVLVVESGMLASQDLRPRAVLPELQDLKLVMIGMEPNEVYERCLRAVGSTYVRWDASAAEVVDAVRTSTMQSAEL